LIVVGAPTVSVVICAYTPERWELLCAAVESVQRQTTPPLETILVIDHNASLLERARHAIQGASLLASNGPAGLSGARNTGLAAASGEVVAFLDDDAVAAPDWLAHLLEAYADPRVVGVGGLIQPAWQPHRPRWFPVEFQWVVGCSYRGLPEDRAPVRNLIGANMSLRRSVFDAAGGFRAELGHTSKGPGGDEETELCIRVRQRRPQAVMVYEPAARVRHHIPPERTTWRYFIKRCAAEGRAKARVAHLVGSDAGLASERTYVSRTLPSGVVRGLADLVLRADMNGGWRAGAILAGLVVTAAAFVWEYASTARASTVFDRIEAGAT
jgi:O-antigen biosynthesis protein